MNEIIEEWRGLPQYPGYRVSNLGRVSGRRKAVLKPWLLRGYPTISLPKLDNHGLELSRSHGLALGRVHRLVCELFHGPAPSLVHHVAHIDGNKENAAADNLMWATPTENEAHKILHGTKSGGDRHGRRKLASEDVKLIRAQHAVAFAAAPGRIGMHKVVKELAEQFGVSRICITQTVARRYWKEVA